MKLHRPCACSTPPVVDLTGAILDSCHQKHGAEPTHQGGNRAFASAMSNGSSSTTPKVMGVQAAQHDDGDNDGPQQRQQEQHCNPQNDHQQQLFENLKSHGWSRLCMDLSVCISEQEESSSESPNTTATTSTNHPHQSILQNCGQDWKKLLVSLFESSPSYANDADDAIYRVAESGSPDGMVEPKQSWEVQRCQCHAEMSPRSNQQQQQHERQEWRLHLERLHAWTNLFHDVASTVRRVVGFPKNVLLQEEPCCCRHCNNDDDDGQEHQSQNDSRTSCSLDLLRAFYYETTSSQERNPSSPTSSNAAVLGSNEHTDWGSFTIVWQDDVPGCLQTFCHACQSWNSVQQVVKGGGTSRRDGDKNMLYLVVHVGDVTSLAIGQQQQEQQHAAATTATEPTGNTAASTVIWPSPRHRVCLPTEKQQRRASLVYFAYPPPEQSIRSISQALREWYHQTTTASRHGGSNNKDAQQPNLPSSSLSSHWVPYDDYFLLKNQATEDNTNNSGQSQFEKIASTPLRIVLNEKWNQVQRA